MPNNRERRAAGTQLTRDDLERGLRTFVAAASCWVHRDPCARDSDVDQAGNLAKVVEALDVMAARQRQIAADVLRSIAIDHLTAAIEDKEKGSDVASTAAKKVRRPTIKSTKEGKASAAAEKPTLVQAEWRRMYVMLEDADPVVRCLRATYMVVTMLTGQMQTLDLQRAQALADAAAQLREPVADPKRDAIRKDAVADALSEDLFADAGYVGKIMKKGNRELVATMNKHATAAARRLRARHADTAAFENAVADAYYFGAARGALSPGPFGPGARGETPAAIAGEFVASALGGGPELAFGIQTCEGSWRGPLTLAALGHAESV